MQAARLYFLKPRPTEWLKLSTKRPSCELLACSPERLSQNVGDNFLSTQLYSVSKVIWSPSLVNFPSITPSEKQLLCSFGSIFQDFWLKTNPLIHSATQIFTSSEVARGPPSPCDFFFLPFKHIQKKASCYLAKLPLLAHSQYLDIPSANL